MTNAKKSNDTQYQQLSIDVRHYDTQLYVIPTTLLVILGTSFKFLVERQDDYVKVGVAFFLVIICHVLTTLFAKLSIHQKATREGLNKIERDDPSYNVIGRATWGNNEIEKIDRSKYDEVSPLWRYFYTSADRAIMRMMMTALWGTLCYFIKSILDLIKLPTDKIDWRLITSILLGSLIFWIFQKIISNEPKAVKL